MNYELLLLPILILIQEHRMSVKKSMKLLLKTKRGKRTMMMFLKNMIVIKFIKIFTVYEVNIPFTKLLNIGQGFVCSN